MNRVPGTYIQRGSGQESLTAIRSPVLTGPGSCGAFLFLENGIPVRPTGFCNVNDLFEVNSEQAEAIEIVRGPGSALYGSSAVHGTVNVLMPTPSQMPRVGVSGEGGPATTSTRLSTSLPAAAPTLDCSAWTRRWLARLQTRKPAQRGSHSSGRDAASSSCVSHQPEPGAGFIQGFEAYKDPELAESNLNPEAFRDAHSGRLTAHWQAPIGTGTQFDLRAVARTSRMEFLQHFLLGKPLEKNGQDSAAVLLSIDRALAGDTQLTMGIDAETSRSTLLEIRTPQRRTAHRLRMPSARRGVTMIFGQRLECGYGRSVAVRGAAPDCGIRAGYVLDYDNHMIAGRRQNSVPGSAALVQFRRIERTSSPIWPPSSRSAGASRRTNVST
jgi:hypothetical protein